MSKRAEAAALKAYPPNRKLTQSQRIIFNDMRDGFKFGYEQAEKDIIDLIESRIGEILGDAQPTPILRYELQDLIKKIKKEQK